MKKETKLSAREIPGVEENKVKRIYGVRVCLRFARGTFGCERITRLGWSRNVFRCENEVVIMVRKDLKRTSQEQSGCVSRGSQRGTEDLKALRVGEPRIGFG